MLPPTSIHRLQTSLAKAVLVLAVSQSPGCNGSPGSTGNEAVPPGTDTVPATGPGAATDGASSLAGPGGTAPAPNDGTTTGAAGGSSAPSGTAPSATVVSSGTGGSAAGPANAATGGAPPAANGGQPEAPGTGGGVAPNVPASGGSTEPGVNPGVEQCGVANTELPALGPVVRVDLDMAGRPEDEVSEIGYTPWPVTDGPSISQTFDGVTFSFTSTGSGAGLTSDWYKAIIQAPSYERLAGDGLTVDGGESGAAIDLSITGLSAGSHSLLVFLNQTQNPDTNSFAPIDISVDGSVVAKGVAPTVRAESNAAARIAYLEFDAVAGQAVTVRFVADTSSNASNKNLMINGFELDVPNAANQAHDPVPVHADEHVAADNGDATLSWAAADSAVSHDVYFGEDPNALAQATPDSCEYRGNQTETSFEVGGLSSLGTYYWRVDEVSANGEVTKGTVWMFRPRHLAFPGAEGYGRFARGGRGGRVVHVTNLNDSGPGSLREAVESDTGARTIVFDVGGMITLSDRLVLGDQHVTVAGQTAPGKGLCIRGAPFGMSGASDAVIRFVRVRLGGGPTFDGMGMSGSDYSIIDHASISWTIDEAFSSRSGKNITLQHTLISECLNVAGHQNYPEGTAHGYAGSISGDIGSFHHNLLAHCEGRNWSLAGGLDGNGDFAGRLDIFNNVVYNWGNRATDGGAHEVNFVANYYKPGAATTLFVALNAQYESFPGTQRYFFSGNVMPGHFDEGSQARGRTVSGTPDGYDPWVNDPFFPSYATVESAGNAYKSVLSDVGTSEPVLDDHDARIIRETLNGTTTYSGSITGDPGLPDNESDVGGYEDFPTTNRDASWDGDGDGLPDFWEAHFGLDPASPAYDFSDANADADGDGYTELDDYLDFMAHPHAITTLGQDASFALSDLFRGHQGSPSYQVSDEVGGSATINGGNVAFTPSECGRGSFVVTVTDADATLARKVFVFAEGC